ncbi:MAG: PTS transporter subunit EIIC [Spirochaetales bacterium]|nr:PTS transporter subunit EIIC [Spirochaetales bacterium]
MPSLITKLESGYKTVIHQISGIFLPIINCLTAASIIKSVIVLMAAAGILAETSGVYQILYACSDGFFYFLPFYLAITASRQWKTDPIISLSIPVAMLYPQIVAVLENGNTMDFFGLTIPATIYHSSVIPVLLAVALLRFVEKPCDKFIPEAVRGFLKPIVCCLVVLPITFLLFGRVGTWIGDFLTKIFLSIYDFSPIFAGAFMGFFIQPMVVVGAHWSIVPVSINNIALNGYDIIMPLLGGAVYGQAGACLALGILRRKDKEKRRIAFQGAMSAALGVTEPALFGVTVPEIRGMLSACVAGAVGGAMAGAAGTHCNNFAFPSYITSVAYVGPGFVTFLISMAVAFAVAFVLVMAQKKWIK